MALRNAAQAAPAATQPAPQPVPQPTPQQNQPAAGTAPVKPAVQAPAPAAPVFEAEAPVANEAPVVEPSTSTAVITAPTNRSVAPLSAKTVLRGLQDVISQVDLQSMGFGVFPRVTVGLDGFTVGKEKELGKKIQFEVISWNFVWIITPGEQNNSEANKEIRTSYDGVNLNGHGQGTIEAYVKHLKEVGGYDKAASKQYVEVYANLLWSEAKGDVAPEDQQIHQISLSPQSVGQWQRYMLEAGMRKMKGIEDSNVVFATQERKVIGVNKFGVAVFSAR